MDNISAFFKLIILILMGVVGVIFVIFFGFWFLMAILAMIGMFIVVWAAGIPITIKENGVKTGYVRWFTFHPTNKPWQ